MRDFFPRVAGGGRMEVVLCCFGSWGGKGVVLTGATRVLGPPLAAKI